MVMGALMFSYQATSFWFATLLRAEGRAPLPYLIALNLGGIAGAVVWGAIADTRLQHRGAVIVAALATIIVVPFFVFTTTATGLWTATVAIGLTAGGIIGVSPALVAGQFEPEVRGTTSGIAYQSASAIGAVAPLVLGFVLDHSGSLRAGMAFSIAAASAAAVVFASNLDRPIAIDAAASTLEHERNRHDSPT
jgi:MFS family permease